MSETLFEGYDPPPPPEAAPVLSADRRRTIRQQQDISNGKHPLTGGPLHPEASTQRTSSSGKRDPFTCGSCLHRVQRGWPKCDLSTMSASAASDVRAWWPACPSYEVTP